MASGTQRPVVRIISLVLIIAIIAIFVYAFFFAEPAPKAYDVSYDSKEGVITIQLQEEIPSGDRIAYIFSQKDDPNPYTKVITEHGKVEISKDLKTIVITDDPGVLVNLENDHYTIRLIPVGSTVATLEYEFNVNNHEFNTGEIIGIAVFITLGVLVVGFVIVRRIVRGR